MAEKEIKEWNEEQPERLQTFLKSRRVKEAATAATAEKVAANSKQKFGNSLEKKFKTTMIGALAKFEERFGHIWGHDKKDDELTEEEQNAREVWLLVRTEILNNGNTQLRHAIDELSRYRITYEGFKMNLPMKPKSLEVK